MTSDGLYISRFIWQVMAYIYIKVYMTSDDLYISRYPQQLLPSGRFGTLASFVGR